MWSFIVSYVLRKKPSYLGGFLICVVRYLIGKVLLKLDTKVVRLEKEKGETHYLKCEYFLGESIMNKSKVEVVINWNKFIGNSPCAILVEEPKFVGRFEVAGIDGDVVFVLRRSECGNVVEFGSIRNGQFTSNSSACSISNMTGMNLLDVEYGRETCMGLDLDVADLICDEEIYVVETIGYDGRTRRTVSCDPVKLLKMGPTDMELEAEIEKDAIRREWEKEQKDKYIAMLEAMTPAERKEHDEEMQEMYGWEEIDDDMMEDGCDNMEFDGLKSDAIVSNDVDDGEIPF